MIDRKPFLPANLIKKYCAGTDVAPEDVLVRLLDDLNNFHMMQSMRSSMDGGKGTNLLSELQETTKVLGPTNELPLSILTAVKDFIFMMQRGQLKVTETTGSDSLNSLTKPRAVLLAILMELVRETEHYALDHVLDLNTYWDTQFPDAPNPFKQ